MVQQNNFVDLKNGEQKKSKILPKIFRVLIKMNIIPLHWNISENQLSFKFISRSFALYYMYYFVLSLNVFVFAFKFGFSKLKEFWENLIFEENITDLLTFLAFNIFGVSVPNIFPIFCKNMTRISTDIVMNKMLSWPNHGYKIILMSFLNNLALNVYTYLFNLLTLDTDIATIAWLIPGLFLMLLFFQLLQTVMYLFILTWLDHFSKICKDADSETVIEHTQKCQTYYKSLQDGLGTTFLIYILILQLMLVINWYMAISSIFFGTYNIWYNVIISICYLLMALYSSTILYSVTTAAEMSYMALQNMIIPLEKLLKMKQNSEEYLDIKLLIREIERTPPLNGNGYFDLKKATITSIISTSVTYLVILLQFRTS